VAYASVVIRKNVVRGVVSFGGRPMPRRRKCQYVRVKSVLFVWDRKRVGRPDFVSPKTQGYDSKIGGSEEGRLFKDVR